MADICQRYGTVLCALFLCSLLLSPFSFRHAEPQNSSPSHSSASVLPPQLPEVLRTAFLGEWKTNSSSLFNRLQSQNGRGYFECRTRDFVECCFIFYDGPWEDDPSYAIEMLNVLFNATEKSIRLSNSTVGLYSKEERNFGHCAVEGTITFRQIEHDLTLSATLLGLDFEFTAEMSVLKDTDRKEPCAVYSIMFSMLALATVYAMVHHSQVCLESPQVAAKTSVGFLLMTGITDVFLCLWHFRQAFQRILVFDYMILGSFWSFAIFMLVLARLVPVVWRAQNPDIINWGYTRARIAFSAFQSRFLVYVISCTLLLAVFSSTYRLTIPLMHLFFLPQIVSNAVHGYRNVLSSKVYLLIGISRLMLSLYLFGCPANFLVWRPDYWMCFWVTLVITGQIAVLKLQNSRIGPRFLIPAMMRPRAYSYFKSEEEEAGVAKDSECVICMSLLNLPNSTREEVVNSMKTMHAPCGHMFHADCLQNWMSVKLECPTCRSTLPLLEED